MRTCRNAAARTAPPPHSGTSDCPRREPGRRPRRGTAYWIATLAVAAALPAQAATFTRRAIDLDIAGPSLTERQEFELELESEADLEAWSSFSFLLDERTDLVDWAAEIVDLTGRSVFRSRREDLREQPPDERLRRPAGRRLHADLAGVAVGHRLRVRLTLRHTPPFPAHMVRLALDTPQQTVRITVRGGDGRLRWMLTPDGRGFAVAERNDGIGVTASDVGRIERLPFAPADDSGVPMLRIAWDRDATWRSVGEWYTGIVGARPQLTPNLRERARSLTEGCTTKRDALIAVADFVKREIGYEAGDVAVGGWQPAPPDEVLSRGRGDCKDKAELLRALLLAAGIESHLALMRLGHTSLIPAAFPSNLGFDHTVVAVPAAAAGAAPGDAIVEELLFVDPTMDRGHALWLSPFNQGQVALVAAGAESRLVEIPILRDTDLRLLILEGEIDRRGRFSGTASLRLAGTPAIVWLRDTEGDPRGRTGAPVDEMLRRVLGQVVVEEAGWETVDGPGPAVRLTAAVEVSGLVADPGGFRELRFPMLDTLPDPRLLLQRRAPLVLSPRTDRTRWRIRLPPGWCPPDEPDEQVERASGRASRSVSAGGDGSFSIEREVRLDGWWFDAGSIDGLRELAAAEDRMARGAFRMVCVGAL